MKRGTKDRGVSDPSADLVFVKRVLDGDENAARALLDRYRAQLMAALCKRGASSTEAEDLLANVWSDCFGGSGKRLLQKYEGRCPLSSWLITVATNKLIDLKRGQAFRGELPGEKSNDSRTNDFEQIGNFPAPQPDNELLALLRQAVINAFAAESPETMLMLRLVYVHGIDQSEIGRIWKPDKSKISDKKSYESTVSRRLKSARERIKTAVLMELQRADPWLKLEWEDFLELARCTPDLA